MATILRIDGSARTEGSASRALLDRIEDRLGADRVIRRDVGTETLPPVTGTWVAGTFTPPDDRAAEHREALALSDRLVAELQEADTVLIGMPIYNFTVPAALKAWIDLVARVGVTFKYTEAGPVGLLENKRAIVAVTSGGTEAFSEIDFASPYIRHFLGFIGIADVEFVIHDRAMGDAAAAAAKAEAGIDALAA